jgi:CO/xanthine dehydrogenase Mo-binding subunit
LTAAHPRQASIITVKTGVAQDGRILAREGRVMVDCGAFSGSGPGTAAIALQILGRRSPVMGEEVRGPGATVCEGLTEKDSATILMLVWGLE